MSEPKRYEFDENGVCYQKDDGPFVSFDDYARLKADRMSEPEPEVIYPFPLKGDLLQHKGTVYRVTAASYDQGRLVLQVEVAFTYPNRE